MRALPLVFLAAGLAGCLGNPTPRLETAADSLAFRVTEGAGGLAAWNALPALSWEWAVIRDSAELFRTRHVWDKRGDRVRSEWPMGADSMAVVVFVPSRHSPDAIDGLAAINGASLAGPERDSLIVQANARFVNDGYWMLAPLKVLDPGVRRAIENRDGWDRLALSFDGVGLTPGDRYWLEIDDVSGAVTGWSFLLQGDSTESHWEWTDVAELPTEKGPVLLTRMRIKDDENSIILTEPRAIDVLDETEFTDLAPRLGVVRD
ncbi:hypothetical protein [Rubrivirga sp. IMCC43871]|uniref:hypothetical protein n=1 Tax=Rubrivirga sp. IMCC43871 TaxID=3391575 RepID=UPI00398F922F